MHSKTIELSKKECVEEIIELFLKDKDITINERSDSLIEFERGGRRRGIIGSKYPKVSGELTFEGNEKTNVGISYNRGYYLFLFLFPFPIQMAQSIIFLFIGPRFLFVGIFELIFWPIFLIISFGILTQNENKFSSKIFNFLEKLRNGEKDYLEFFEPERSLFGDYLFISIILAIAFIVPLYAYFFIPS